MEPCMAFCQTILNDERMISILREGEILILSPTSMAAIFSILGPSSVAFIISLGLRNDFWKGREDKVFEQLGPEIKDEALQLLEVKVLVRIFKHCASQDLGSRVARVLVDKNENGGRKLSTHSKFRNRMAQAQKGRRRKRLTDSRSRAVL